MRKASLCHQEMSTTDYFHHFPFSEKRKKVDMEYAVSSLQGESNCSKSESVCDLRKSLAWDSAFFTSPGILDPEELFGNVNIQFVDNGEDVRQGRGRKSLKLDFAETERTSATHSSCVRKSLAWDSAFLTCEGVLNAEELSIVNRGFRKSKMHSVAEINEELWGSAESNATIRQDDYSLSSLEVDLFDDMRSNMPNFDEASRGRTTHKLAGEKRLHTARKPAASLQDSNGVSSSLPSLKPPKVSGSANPPPRAPKKRTSLGANKVSPDTKSTRRVPSQKSMTSTKKTCLRESLSTVSSSTSSMKSNSSALHSAKKELAGLSAHKSPNPLRRTDSQLVSSVLGSRTPPNFSARNRRNSASSLSTPKSFSCASSVSSIDGLSSELPGSSVERRLKLSASSNSTPCRVFPLDFDDTEGLDSASPLINRSSAGAGASPVSPLTYLKTSGLRMPSPKIGFFDTESLTGLQQDEHPKFQSGLQDSKCISAAANRTRNRNPVLMEKLSGIRSSREKPQRNVSRQVSDKNSSNSEEHNKENAGNLGNQVDVLIKRIDAIGISKRKGARSHSPLPVQNTRNRMH